MIAKKGVFDALARRFSVNQFLILAGCVLLLYSMAFNFTTHRISFMQERNVTGFSMLFVAGDWGFSIIYNNVFELLIPIIVVVVSTVVGIRIESGKLIALIASCVGLFFGLSILISLFNSFNSFITAGTGLLAFIGLWVVIVVMTFLEYKDMHPLERRKSCEKAPGQTEV